MPKEDTAAIWQKRGSGRLSRRHPLLHGGRRFRPQGARFGVLYFAVGIVTFKNAKDLQDVAKWLPADRILVEQMHLSLKTFNYRPSHMQKPASQHLLRIAEFVASLRE